MHDNPRRMLERTFVVSLEERPRRTDDGIDILPAKTFFNGSQKVRASAFAATTCRRRVSRALVIS